MVWLIVVCIHLFPSDCSKNFFVFEVFNNASIFFFCRSLAFDTYILVFCFVPSALVAFVKSFLCHRLAPYNYPRAYINFVNVEDILEFSEMYDGSEIELESGT